MRQCIESNNIKTVFFGKRTARNIEGECFLFIFESMFYVFTYHSKFSLFNSIQDYKNAKERNYLNAMTFYTFFEKNKEIKYFDEYLLKEYQVNEYHIMEYLSKYSSGSEDKNYFKFIEIIVELEEIKNKYNLDNSQSIIAYIIIHYIKEKSVNTTYLIEKCSSGIYLDSYDLRIKLSDEYIGKYSKYVKEESVFSDKGHWEYDENIFVGIVNEILKKINEDLFVDKSVRHNDW